MNPGVAIALACALALAGSGLRWLSVRGAVAAAAVGAAVFWGRGLAGGILLGLFFVSGSLLTRIARRAKSTTQDDLASRGRTASQVLANGFWASLAALVPMSFGGWALFGGAIAAALADTWATEIGAFSRTAPRMLTSGEPVNPGTSGGVTPLGTVGSISGAAGLGILAWLLTETPGIGAATAIGGTVGTLTDSLLGATAQGVYFCETCGVETEQRRHGCAGRPRRVRGLAWLDNDGVNFCATGTGAAVGLAVWLVL